MKPFNFETAVVYNAIIREFVVVGDGDFDKLQCQIEAKKKAWVGDLVDGKAVVAYSVLDDTEELLASVIAAAIGSGYMITRTRLRTLVQTTLIRFSSELESGVELCYPEIKVTASRREREEAWQDFAFFKAVRNFRHWFHGSVVEGLHGIAIEPIDGWAAAEGGPVVAENGAVVEARAGRAVCARNGSTVYAWRDSQVVAQCGSTVFAYSGADVYADAGAVVHAEVGSVVTARSGSTVYAAGGSYSIACSGSTVHAGSGSNVVAYPGSVVIALMGSEVSYIP